MWRNMARCERLVSIIYTQRTDTSYVRKRFSEKNAEEIAQGRS